MMENLVLLVEDQNRIEPVLQKLFKGSSVRLVTHSDLLSAKRSLLQETPQLVIAVVALQKDTMAGFRFARELSGHEQFSQIPLVLIADELSEDVIREATTVGAKALIPWPVGVESLRNRFKAYLPGLAGEAEKIAPAQISAPTRAEKIKHEAPAASSSAEKIHLAQQLLAKVLHNLKTSDLLEVVDLEDVPRVVSEITRSLCGVQTKKEAPVDSNAAPKPAQGETKLDLDSIFNFKK